MYKSFAYLLTYFLSTLVIYLSHKFLFCGGSSVVPNVEIVFIRVFQVQNTCFSCNAVQFTSIDSVSVKLTHSRSSAL